MSKLPKEKRDKLTLIMFGVGALVIGLYMFLISGLRSALSDCAARSESLKDKLAKAERWQRMAPEVESKLAAVRNELDAKQDAMAPPDKLAWFYDTLAKFIAGRQITLVDITREPVIGAVGVLPDFPYSAAIFGVKLNAAYHDFGAFLADFENQFPYMRVQDLDLEPENKVLSKDGTPVETPSTETGRLAITMRVVTLIKPTASL